MQKIISEYLSYLENERNYSQHTVVSYANDLAQYYSFLKKDFPELITQHNDTDIGVIRAFLGLLLDSGLSKKSVVRKLSTLRSFYKFLVRKKIVRNNPALNVVTPKIEKNESIRPLAPVYYTYFASYIIANSATYQNPNSAIHADHLNTSASQQPPSTRRRLIVQPPIAQ